MNESEFEVQTIHQLLSEYEAERIRLTLTPSDRSPKIAFLSAACLWAVAMIAYVFQRNIVLRQLSAVSLGCGVLAYLASLVLLVIAHKTYIKIQVLGLLDPVGAALKASTFIAQSDHDFSANLASYDKTSLTFIGKRMHSQAEGMRFRLGMVLGAIEKVGIFPLIITFGLALWGLWPKVKNGELPIDPFTFWLGAIALVLLYFVGFIRLAATRRLDELAEVIEFAAE